MKRLFAFVLIVSCVMISLLAAPTTAAAQDIKQVPLNLGIGIINIPCSFANGVKGAAEEVEKRGVVSIVSGPLSFGLNIATTVVSSALTIGTLGLVPPVNDACSGDPPPAVFPEK